MKREELKKIIEGITDEQLQQILDINGTDIENAKGDSKTLKADLETANKTIDDLKRKISDFETSSASAEDYKKKFEGLQKEIQEKEKADKEAKAQADKEANILNRFTAVSVDAEGKPLEWINEFTQKGYLQKFSAELDNEANVSKSDADIFKSITKDAQNIYKTIQPIVNLKGVGPIPTGDEATINSIMGLE